MAKKKGFITFSPNLAKKNWGDVSQFFYCKFAQSSFSLSLRKYKRKKKRGEIE
jgi:hypothetical protein